MIPADRVEAVQTVLDPDGLRSAFHRVDAAEALRWSAVEYLTTGDRTALQPIVDAGEVEIAHALAMYAAIGGLPAGAQRAAKVDDWFSTVDACVSSSTDASSSGLNSSWPLGTSPAAKPDIRR